MKLLIIEDNKLLASSLKAYLQDSYVIDVSHRAAEGIALAKEKHFDIIILDLVLPDGSGLNVCRTLRGSGITTPILILTAAKDTLTKVQLLDTGADDFLTKPFQASELQARLRAILRRTGSASSKSRLVVDELTIDLTTRTVIRDGKEIILRRKEYDILEYLMRNQGRVITRQMILDHVWESDSYTTSNTVDVHMKHLRDKVDRDYARKFIETVYGFGYIIR